MGVFVFISQIGSAAAPWIAKGLIQYHVSLPLFVMGCMTLGGCICTIPLRETKGIPIDNFIQGIEGEGITNKFAAKICGGGFYYKNSF